MSDPVIRVENLGKHYRLRHQQTERYTALRDVIAHGTQSFLQRLNPLNSYKPERATQREEEFWALKDVSFEVNAGDRIGIIGRNGAGKSTLLKILSRITEPTTGSIRIKGRVASLLEVGTGFHPELTGRENIFLNGAILGMGKAEIRRRFDEIVAFAEVDRFLDTPVKRYSSGMYVRLAFAVAAHLEPEVLIVDEVLAVGDAQFQKKCLGKMEDVSKEGRTVLFVSHNLGAIKALTQNCLYLKNGKTVAFGETEKIVKDYTAIGMHVPDLSSITLDNYRGVPKSQQIISIEEVEINNKNPLSQLPIIEIGAPINIRLKIKSSEKINCANCAIVILNSSFEPLTMMLAYDACTYLNLVQGENILNVEIKGFSLLPGDYYIDVGVNRFVGQPLLDLIRHLPAFQIANIGKNSLQYKPERMGFFVANQVSWEISLAQEV